MLERKDFDNDVQYLIYLWDLISPRKECLLESLGEDL